MTTFEYATETPDALTTVEAEIDEYSNAVTLAWGTRTDDDGQRDLTSEGLAAYLSEHRDAILEAWVDGLVGAEEVRVAQNWG